MFFFLIELISGPPEFLAVCRWKVKEMAVNLSDITVMENSEVTIRSSDWLTKKA